jgi:hypothetical protein
MRRASKARSAPALKSCLGEKGDRIARRDIPFDRPPDEVQGLTVARWTMVKPEDAISVHVVRTARLQPLKSLRELLTGVFQLSPNR